MADGEEKGRGEARYCSNSGERSGRVALANEGGWSNQKLIQ